MKVTNWRRKLAATLVAGGLMSPTAANAANLNTNLVINGTFENVDLNTFGEYAGPLVLNWSGPNLFAYSHDGSTSAGSGQPNPNDPPNNFPDVVPDYAEGDDPPNAGHWYFTPNNTGFAEFTDVHDPGVYYQDIDVSTGPTATAIADGKGRANLAAYMSSYLNDTDVCICAGGIQGQCRREPRASPKSTDSDPGPENVWNLNNGSGAIPTGTSTLRVSRCSAHAAPRAGAAATATWTTSTYRSARPPIPSF